MKGYGPMGHGVPFSLSSNLSPLAPPFTVDPSFLGSVPVHDPPLGNRPENRHEPYFGDDPHYAFSARPPHDNWLQMNSQAYEPNLFPNPNPVTSPPISKSSDYGQSTNNFFSPQSGSWPYHPQYPPVSFDGSNTSFDVNERGNVVPASIFSPTAPSGGFWNAKSDSEPWKAKGKDVNVSASPSYASVVNRGISSTDGLSAREEPSRVWVGKSVESSAVRNFFGGSRETNLPTGKLSSISKENYRDIPFDMSRINPASFKEMPYNLTPPPDFAMESWTQLTPSIPSYGGYFTGGDAYKSDPLCFYPVSSKSSLDQTFESISGKPTTLTSKSGSTSTSPIERPKDAWQRKEGSTWDSPSSMGCPSVMDEISTCYVGTCIGVEEYVDPHASSGKPTTLTSKSGLTSTSPFERRKDACQMKEGSTWESPSSMGCTPVIDEISTCYVGTCNIVGVDEYADPHTSSDKSTTLMSKSVSTSTSPIERPRDARQRKEGFRRDSPSNMGVAPVMAEISEWCRGISSINHGVGGYVDPLMLNDVVPLLRSPAPSVDPLNHLVKAENKVQVTELDPPEMLLTAETGVVDSVECSSEVLEQFNPGVDSPCWKGASDSRYSLFGASDAGTTDIPAKIFEGCSTLNIQGPQESPVNSDKAVAFSTKIQRNDKSYGEDGSPSLLQQAFAGSTQPPRDHHSRRMPLLELAFPGSIQPSGDHHSKMPKLGPGHSQFSNKNVIQFSVPNNTDGGSDLESSETNIFCNDECTDASRQASYEVRIANPGIGNLAEPIQQPSTSTKFRKGDVGLVVNMMQNLSELFLSNCYTDEVALKEQDHVVIEQVIQNLETCLERVGTTRPSPKTQNLQCEMSKCCVKATDATKDTAAGGSQATEVKDVESRWDIQNASKGKKISNMDYSRPLSFPSGDSEIEQDAMTKGIKTILEENFGDEEEKEPQSMLYKNLWLEAEAALCSINYKARFARVKVEMEKYKQHQTKGELIDVEKPPSSNGPDEIRSFNLVEPKSKESEDNEVASHPENTVDSKSQETEDGQGANLLMQDLNESTTASNPENTVESKSKESEDSEVATVFMPDHRESSTVSRTENLDASVMARFHILKSRINNKVKEGQPHDSVSAEDIVMKPQQPKLVNLNFSEARNPLHFMSENSEVDCSYYMDHYSSRYPSPFIRSNKSELDITPHMDHFSVLHAEENPGFVMPHDLVEFGAMQSAGDYDSHSPSSDWEHVLKEAAWPA